MKDPSQSKHLVPSSPFWSAAALHFVKGEKDLLCDKFMYLKNKVEFTLASCFIPNSTLVTYEMKNQEDAIIIEATSPFLVFVKEVKTRPYEKKFGVLLNQRFLMPDNRYYYDEEGNAVEREVT